MDELTERDHRTPEPFRSRLRAQILSEFDGVNEAEVIELETLRPPTTAPSRAGYVRPVIIAAAVILIAGIGALWTGLDGSPEEADVVTGRDGLCLAFLAEAPSASQLEVTAPADRVEALREMEVAIGELRSRLASDVATSSADLRRLRIAAGAFGEARRDLEAGDLRGSEAAQMSGMETLTGLNSVRIGIAEGQLTCERNGSAVP